VSPLEDRVWGGVDAGGTGGAGDATHLNGSKGSNGGNGGNGTVGAAGVNPTPNPVFERADRRH
ncbi:hypothetical protein OSH48_25235, partial [Mycobacterium ulcerans]